MPALQHRRRRRFFDRRRAGTRRSRILPRPCRGPRCRGLHRLAHRARACAPWACPNIPRARSRVRRAAAPKRLASVTRSSGYGCNCAAVFRMLARTRSVPLALGSPVTPHWRSWYADRFAGARQRDSEPAVHGAQTRVRGDVCGEPLAILMDDLRAQQQCQQERRCQPSGERQAPDSRCHQVRKLWPPRSRRAFHAAPPWTPPIRRCGRAAVFDGLDFARQRNFWFGAARRPCLQQVCRRRCCTGSAAPPAPAADWPRSRLGFDEDSVKLAGRERELQRSLRRHVQYLEPREFHVGRG